MKELFENLASQFENTTFSCNDYAINRLIATKIPVSIYTLEVIYKGQTISIKYELGNQNLGSAELRIKHKLLPDFGVTCTNLFFNLFLRKKDLLKVECSDNKFREILQKKLIETRMEQIAKDNQFEPTITCKSEMLSSDIFTQFHLEFTDKIGAAVAVIDFYKFLIDY